MTMTAVVFPGQGSQFVGMLGDLVAQFPQIRYPFQEVSDHLGYDVWNLIQKGPEALLNRTEHTQVAMLTADVALFQVLQAQQPMKPKMMAGHSLGEYAALVCAQSLNLGDAAKLVQTRGRLMQETIPMGTGAMAAIVGLDDDVVRKLCLQATTTHEQVTPANYNTLGQVVIAGHHAAVTRALALAEAADARLAKVIPVSVPCHCDLLKPAAEKFAQALAETQFQLPLCEVVSNVDVSIYSSVAQIRTLLAQQLYSPVRWVETIQRMQKNGITAFLECGPGRVLSGLIKRLDKSLEVSTVQDTLLQKVE